MTFTSRAQKKNQESTHLADIGHQVGEEAHGLQQIEVFHGQAAEHFLEDCQVLKLESRVQGLQAQVVQVEV